MRGRNVKRRGSREFAHGCLSALLAASLTLAPFSQAAFAASSASAAATLNDFSRADYDACQAQTEDAFQAAVRDITVTALKSSLETVDYPAIVAEEWRRNNVDDIVDTRVDIATAEVRDQTSWGALIQSLAYKEKAQELATAVAERVYRSDPMKEAIATLAAGVSKQVGKRIEFASRDAAAPALKCLQAYLGPRYGNMIAATVTEDAGTQFGLSAGPGGATVTPGSVLRESSAGLTGAAILLVRRQLANLARNIGQRLVGAVLSRLVSVVAGGVGLVLIAKDVWDLRFGVLPIIADEMKSQATKEKVREELAKTISEQISQHVEEIGEQSAARVVGAWKEFRSAHLWSVQLAGSNDNFRAYLDALRPEQLAKLDQVVALVLSAEGEKGVLRRLEDATLNEAVNDLSDDGLTIARETRSMEKALKWSAVAGDDLSKVVDYGIYRTSNPSDFTAASLKRVLAIGDRVAITRLASIARADREALFDLENTDLKGLARHLTGDELSTLSSYLTGLQQGPREQVLRTIAKSPGKMQALASTRVRNAVVSSADQDAAVEMMLRGGSAFDPNLVVKDFELAWKGRVSPVLIVDKHPIALGLLVVGLLMALLILRRLFFVRLRRARTVESADNTAARSGNTKAEPAGKDPRPAPS